MNRRARRSTSLLSLAAVFTVAAYTAAFPRGAATADEFQLELRTCVEVSPDSDLYRKVVRDETWDASETAVIVCDMWDSHHCLNAVRRVGEMAPRMNRVLHTLRDAGAVVIHAPSSCMEFYANHPARVRAEKTSRVANLPPDIGQWCHSIPSEEQGEYPIDQSDGGEDDDPIEHEQWQAKLRSRGLDPGSPWKRQVATLEIRDTDYISDDGEEIWSILAERGVDNVILVGVHTNMCVLGRPFGLRQMAQNGKNVVLMRDLTDTMYNPARAPRVSHFTGTDLIVNHIEKYVCPTITSDQILGGVPFRFRNDDRPRVAILIAEREYETKQTLPKFAAKHLGKEFQVRYVHGSEESRNELPGVTEAAADADVLLVSVRRRLLPPAQLDVIRQHVESGKPVVGIRTANHAFSVRNDDVPSGLADWSSFDADVFGGNYTGHHGSGPDVNVAITNHGEIHSILNGVDVEQLSGKGSLYKVSPLDASAGALLTGKIPGKPVEPIAWVNITAHGGRAFYTSLGHVGDFDQPSFNRLLLNAVRWAAGLPTE